MKITFESKYEYIPEWNGNREDEAPCKFFMRHLTSPEREQCVKTEIIAGGKESHARVTTDKERLVRLAVVKIENLTDASGREIKTAKDFLECVGVDDLFEEVATVALTKNQRPDLKN